jgi:hypothetical protein
MSLRQRLVPAVLGLLFASGCGGHDDTDQPGFKPLSTMGPLGVPAPTLVGQNLTIVDVTIDGFAGGRLLVDTGSPFTIVNGSLFAGVMLPLADQVKVDVGVGDLVIDQVPALQATGTSMDQLRLAGIFGGNVLRQFSSTFNYRDRSLALGDAQLPDGVEDVTKVAFELAGGGLGRLSANELIEIPKTRVPVTAAVEGANHHFILDTGASDVVLRTQVFDALSGDGRPTLDDAPVSTVSGTTHASVTRAKSIALGGETVTDVPVMSFGDDILDAVSSELGYTIDGLFGGDFLREFLLTIDYPKGAVELRRYTTRDHIVDEFKRVGVWIEASGATGFVVGVVHAGSDAEKKGVTAGDELLAVDGTELAGLDLIAADALLDGTVGDSHRIRFGHTQNPSLAETEAAILIEDLVPSPSN